MAVFVCTLFPQEPVQTTCLASSLAAELDFHAGKWEKGIIKKKESSTILDHRAKSLVNNTFSDMHTPALQLLFQLREQSAQRQMKRGGGDEMFFMGQASFRVFHRKVALEV